MTNKRIVLTTTSSKAEAAKIAGALVARKLAACVNVVGPIDSVYRWKGAVERAEEFLCIIKTTAGAAAKVNIAIQQLHSYELPEVLVVPLEAGSKAYLDWIGKNVR